MTQKFICVLLIVRFVVSQSPYKFQTNFTSALNQNLPINPVFNNQYFSPSNPIPNINQISSQFIQSTTNSPHLVASTPYKSTKSDEPSPLPTSLNIHKGIHEEKLITQASETTVSIATTTLGVELNETNNENNQSSNTNSGLGFKKHENDHKIEKEHGEKNEVENNNKPEIKPIINAEDIVLVGLNDGNHFYDEDDLQDEIKRLIVNEVLKNDLSKEFAKAGDDTPFNIPITIALGDGTKKIINITIKTEFTYASNSRRRYQDPFSRNDALDEFDPQYLPPEAENKKIRVNCEIWRDSVFMDVFTGPTKFTPKCNPDGSFAREQCDSKGSPCWCVDKNGSPLPGSLVFHKYPECDSFRSDDQVDIILGNDSYSIDTASETINESVLELDIDRKLSNCITDRKERLEIKRKMNGIINMWIPKCSKDGSYHPTQCTKGGKHCWCVTKDGEEIPGTGTFNGLAKDCSGVSERFEPSLVSRFGWDYLWSIVQTWHSTVINRTSAGRSKNPHFIYKPPGLLVKLLPSSGFKSSMMFLAKEAAGPGLPSPYDVWQELMNEINPGVNINDYILDTGELKKLKMIRIPNGNGGFRRVSIGELVDHHPAITSLWQRYQDDIEKFKAAILKLKLNWAEIDSSSVEKTNSYNYPGANPLLGKKICFCAEGEEEFDSERRIRRSSTLIEDFEEEKTGQDYCDAENSNCDVKSNSKFVELISNQNPFRKFLYQDIGWVEDLPGLDMGRIKIPKDLIKMKTWECLAEKSDLTLNNLGHMIKVDFINFHENPEEKFLLADLFSSLRLTKLKTGGFFHCLGIDLDSRISRIEESLSLITRIPNLIVSDAMTKATNLFFEPNSHRVNDISSHLVDESNLFHSFFATPNYFLTNGKITNQILSNMVGSFEKCFRMNANRIDKFTCFPFPGFEFLMKTFEDYFNGMIHKLQPKLLAQFKIYSGIIWNSNRNDVLKVAKLLYILMRDYDEPSDRIIDLLPTLSELTGDLTRPLNKLLEPFLRTARYLMTGNKMESLRPGYNITEEVIKIFSDFDPIKGKMDSIEKSVHELLNPISKINNYNIDPKNKEITAESFIENLLKGTEFLIEVGGEDFKIFGEFVKTIITSIKNFFFANGNVSKRFHKTVLLLDSGPDCLKSIADIFEELSPLVSTLDRIISGSGTAIDLTVVAPALVTNLANGTLYEFLDNPSKILDVIIECSDLTDNGKLGKLIESIDAPVNWNDLGVISNVEPVGSFIICLQQGVLGNILDPEILLNREIINFENDPFNEFLNILLSPKKLLNSVENKNDILQKLSGGFDPEILKSLGIDLEKIISADINPIQILSGINFMNPELRKLVMTPREPNKIYLNMIGISEDGLKKIGLNHATMLAAGILGSDDGNLEKYGINPDLLINRLMKNSIKNMKKFKSCGIDVRKLVWFGIDPGYLIGLGLRILPDNLFNHSLSNDTLDGKEKILMKIGINPYIMDIKGIKWMEMWNGIGNMSKKEVLDKFGIDKHFLMDAVMGKLNHMNLIGIDIVRMIKLGIKPYSIIMPSEKLFEMDDEKLSSHGFDLDKLKKNGIDIRYIFKNGIKLNQTDIWSSLLILPGDIINLIIRDLGLEKMLMFNELLSNIDKIFHHFELFSFGHTNQVEGEKSKRIELTPLTDDNVKKDEEIHPPITPIQNPQNLMQNPHPQQLFQQQNQQKINQNWQPIQPRIPPLDIQNSYSAKNFINIPEDRFQQQEQQQQQQPEFKFQQTIPQLPNFQLRSPDSENQENVRTGINSQPLVGPACYGPNCNIKTPNSNEQIYPQNFFYDQPVVGWNY